MRFEREARIAASLSHPNLVRLFDYASEADRPFLVMEYVDGGTLADGPGTGEDGCVRCRTPREPRRRRLDAAAHVGLSSGVQFAATAEHYDRFMGRYAPTLAIALD